MPFAAFCIGTAFDTLHFQKRTTVMSGILWVIIVGFIAGIIARLLSPGPNNPSGFILTTVLGIVGAFLATFIAHAIVPYGLGLASEVITITIFVLDREFIWNK